ncbi:MAG TPA: protein kinase [Gemmatimonadales bacterium]|nr:protein kinase [Gemmatimonadales bacterium]
MPHLRAALEAALGPIYMVEREVRPVGGCRMFVVLELPSGPELLVKALPAATSMGLDPGMFEREVLLLADRLADPNVVPPRGAGRAGSFVYHTRRFVEGSTLRALLAREGAFSLHRTVQLLRDILGALAHAHTAGVPHGDLKAENVLVADGRAFLVDTGMVDAVARVLEGGIEAATAALCAPAYLAPERRDGGGTAPTDDVFAVGVLVHEMMTGHLPLPEDDPLDEVRTLPSWFAELVRRCLAPDPAARWPNAGAAITSLSRGSWG